VYRQSARHVLNNNNKLIETASAYLAKKYPASSASATQFLPVGKRTDQLGLTHVTFQQQAHGIPAFHHPLVVHLDRNGNAYKISGTYVVLPPVQLPSCVAESAARAALKKSVTPTASQSTNLQLVFYIGPDGVAVPAIAGLISQRSESYQALINAETGARLQVYPLTYSEQ
jgi:Zn-dependent metalloprotease